MNAVAKSMTDTAYAQLITLREGDFKPRKCIEMTIDSLMEEYGCTRRRAALLALQAWTDLEATDQPAAFIDVSLTTGNMVVIHDGKGRTRVFSVHELLQLHGTPTQATRIHA